MRKLRNLYINPNLQLRYAFYFSGASLAIMGLLYMNLTKTISEISEKLLILDGSLTTQTEISRLLIETSITTLIAFFANIILNVIISLWLTHRVVGPAFRIQELLQKLIQGEYGTQSNLRKSDDLQGVMADLNKLSITLKQKHN